MLVAMKCLLCDDTGWVCEAHPVGRPARLQLWGGPARPALTAIAPMPAIRRGCRRDLTGYLKHGALLGGLGHEAGAVQAGHAGIRPDEPTAGKPDGS